MTIIFTKPFRCASTPVRPLPVRFSRGWFGGFLQRAGASVFAPRAISGQKRSQRTTPLYHVASRAINAPLKNLSTLPLFDGLKWFGPSLEVSHA